MPQTGLRFTLNDDVAHVATVGDLPFNSNTRTEFSTHCISLLHYRAQIRHSWLENQDYTFKSPRWAAFFSHHPRHLNGQRTQYEILGYPGRFKDEQHGREWQVTSSILWGRQPRAQHGNPGEGTLNNSLEVMPTDRTWHVTPLLKPRIDGPQSAIVMGPPGEEIFCDKYGRVRVRFHWDRYCPGNENSSCWVRVSQAVAGVRWERCRRQC